MIFDFRKKAMETTAVNAQTSRDEFLHLLVTQLRHQDPLEPIKQEDFLSQLAQFSTLEGIETLNSSFEQQLAIQQDLVQMQQFTQSSSLIGKQVTFESESSEANKEGIVEGVVVTHDGLRLRVADEVIEFGQIKSLTSASPKDPSTTETQPVPQAAVASDSDTKPEPTVKPQEEPKKDPPTWLFPRTLLRTTPTSNSLK